MIAWEAIGILYRSGKRGRDAAGWLAGLVRVKFCERVRANCEKSGTLAMFVKSVLDCSVSSFAAVIFSHTVENLDARAGNQSAETRMDLSA